MEKAVSFKNIMACRNVKMSTHICTCIINSNNIYVLVCISKGYWVFKRTTSPGNLWIKQGHIRSAGTSGVNRDIKGQQGQYSKKSIQKFNQQGQFKFSSRVNL